MAVIAVVLRRHGQVRSEAAKVRTCEHSIKTENRPADCVARIQLITKPTELEEAKGQPQIACRFNSTQLDFRGHNLWGLIVTSEANEASVNTLDWALAKQNIIILW